MDINEHIIKLRKEKGYSTTRLAKLAGIAQSTLREIELGNTSPTFDTIRKISIALGVPPFVFAIDPDFQPPELSEFLLAGTSLEFRRIVLKLKQLPPDKLKILESVLDTWVESN
ncbi:Helix-turn-helix [Desulfotomaculum arcticum]|uniref:Helix-turn-helix n=1 Tax=Desulfotruncus arcticus DSM 17038 TaxID=1121424 RepID=A0A1I2YB17_9FIRM|nr:helix-turn-helix transcriptional regulator [Desulfotruncus arcticus]SFH22156.1 Helix-turn-helix [Desulfotomaculum arcticum] [Desulfotruncus arcticus DSM 17038]